uniref:Uncharacterized protein n=1 Tax=Picea glauca TaxID=3330 RepID=A0A101LU57_PICGL|nr:hypothetical protein ABT39_MTgene2669 [Picea glauca]
MASVPSGTIPSSVNPLVGMPFGWNLPAGAGLATSASGQGGYTMPSVPFGTTANPNAGFPFGWNFASTAGPSTSVGPMPGGNIAPGVHPSTPSVNVGTSTQQGGPQNSSFLAKNAFANPRLPAIFGDFEFA